MPPRHRAVLIPRREASPLHPGREAWRAVALPLAILGYLALPGAIARWVGATGWSAGGAAQPLFSPGPLNLNAHYALALAGLALLGAAAAPRAARWLGLLWLHLDFSVRAVEAGLLAETGIGISPLALHHLDGAAFALGLRREWPLALAALAVLFALHALLGWLWPVAWPRPWRAGPGGRHSWPAWGAFAVALLLLAASLNSARIVVAERQRLGRGDFPLVSLAQSGWAYWGPAAPDPRFRLSTGERTLAKTWGVDLEAPRPRLAAAGEWAAQPSNLLLVYLEGWQAALGAPDGPLPADLNPHLRRFAQRHTLATGFHGTVTPTINGLIASQCGLPIDLGNRDLQRDRGLLRNLTCLGDLLREAGYRQEFMGGASAAFSGKEAFLRAHGYDRVWGWDDWRKRPEYVERRNDWGLHDTDLVLEALERLAELATRQPFNLTLLTLGTHPPGFPAPNCPVYREGAPWLNAIHCTDRAIGLLLAGLAESGLAESTLVMLVGDHTLFPLPGTRAGLPEAVSLDWYGPLFLAWTLPASRSEPSRSARRRLATPGHTPDLAPTVMALLGLPIEGAFPAARSLLAPPVGRRLVAPRAEVVRGLARGEPPGEPLDCPREAAALARLEPVSGPLPPCSRRRLADALSLWALEQPLR